MSEVKRPKSELVTKTPDVLTQIDETRKAFNLQLLGVQNRFQGAIQMAQGITQLKTLLKPYVSDLRPLMGSPLGFLTDMDSRGGYDDETILNCVTEGLLRGVLPINNEMNIIARRLYITKNGYRKLLMEYEGFSNLKLRPSVPVMKTNGCVVVYTATWLLHGQPQSLEREIPVRINTGQGADVVLGKAERKMLAAIYAQITGSHWAYDPEEEEDYRRLQQTSRSEAVLAQLTAAKPNGSAEQDGTELTKPFDVDLPVPATSSSLLGDTPAMPSISDIDPLR